MSHTSTVPAFLIPGGEKKVNEKIEKKMKVNFISCASLNSATLSLFHSLRSAAYSVPRHPASTNGARKNEVTEVSIHSLMYRYNDIHVSIEFRTNSRLATKSHEFLARISRSQPLHVLEEDLGPDVR